MNLRNIILSGDYLLPSSPPYSELKHRNQDVKIWYDISLYSASAATYQQCVDHGRGTSSFDVPNPCPNCNTLWQENTSCNKLPDTIIQYWDGSYLKANQSWQTSHGWSSSRT